ncbi:MAG TPA: DMT family transporter [Terriglobales bacterium]|nr:DMT family transporter [Terriglobales bacterium]
MAGSVDSSSAPTSKALTPQTGAPNSLRGFLYIGVATFFWGFSATLGRAAFTGRLLPSLEVRGIDPVILSQCRTGFSFLALAVWLIARRGIRALHVPWRDLAKLVLLGLAGLVVSNYFYYLAIQRTNVATAIIVQYTAPVWVLLYMVARGAERLTASKMGSVLLAIMGIALVIGIFRRGGIQLDVIGVTAALVASFSFAYYNVAGHYLLERYDRWMVILYATLAASLFWIIVNPPDKIIAAHYSGGAWVFLAVFSFLSMLLPFTLYFTGLKLLVPTKAIIASCLEPVFAILIAAIALREAVGFIQAIGIVMVLGAIVLAQKSGPDPRPITGPVD